MQQLKQTTQIVNNEQTTINHEVPTIHPQMATTTKYTNPSI